LKLDTKNRAGLGVTLCIVILTALSLGCVGVVNVIKPLNNEVVELSTPTMKWSLSNYSKPVTYDLIIAENEDFTNVVVSETGLKSAEYTPEKPLEPGKQYFWKIKAIDIYGKSVSMWSGILEDGADGRRQITPFSFRVADSASGKAALSGGAKNGFELSQADKEFDPSSTITNLVQVTKDPAPDYEAVVSDNGTLAFTSLRNGNPDIYIKTNSGAGAIQKTFAGSVDNHPFWLDDSILVFNSDRLSKSENQLFYVNVKSGGKGKTQLTQTASETAIEGTVLNKKTKEVIFSLKLKNMDSVYLWTLETKNRTFTQLIPGFSPAVSKSGKIAYVTDKAGQADIWVMDLNANTETQITIDPSHDYDPAWSPDGEWIVFTSNRSGNSDIWIMKSDGNKLTQVTTHPTVDRHPGFSPDGKYIYFQSMRSGNLDIWKMEFKGIVEL